MVEWKVYLNDKHILSVFFDGNFSAEDVRKFLIEERKCDNRIVIKKVVKKNNWLGSIDIEPLDFGNIEI